MKINKIGISFVLFFITIQVFAQSKITDLVGLGVEYHEKGEYEKAIKTYEKALKIDAKSALVNYEIAYSYFANREYKKAIKHTNVVLSQKKDYMIPAYLTKGSSLDLLGKTKKSIQVFEKAIKETEGHYLLYFNLALNYYNTNDLDNAEKNVIKAIEQNSNHTSSHLMLANIHNQRGNSVQTVLATYYSLFLEPNTSRSKMAFQILQENLAGNVSKDPNNSYTINISISEDSESDFSAAEFMLAMLEASKSIEKSEGKTEDQLFVSNTDSFFKFMGELKEKENNDIWWGFYTSFFYDLSNSGHIETFCKYISQSDNENAKKWLSENKDKLSDFDTWLEKH